MTPVKQIRTENKRVSLASIVFLWVDCSCEFHLGNQQQLLTVSDGNRKLLLPRHPICSVV